MKNMGKIHVVEYTDHWTAGGEESYITKLVTGLDKNKFDIRILTAQKETDLYDIQLLKNAVEVHSLMKEITNNPILRVKKTMPLFRKYFMENPCDILHLHIRQGVSLRYAKIAKQCGVHRIIAHSHNSKLGEGHFLLKWVAHQCGKKLYGSYVDERLACSDKAARWLFSKKDLFMVKYVNYLVDVDRFRFSERERMKMRRKYGIKNEVVYLTVGRMNYQKNPKFLLRIFRELAYEDKESRFVWIGTGEYRDQIHQLAKDWALYDRIFFVDGTLEVEKYMSMCDVFLLPSFFEGNPIVIAEAQAAGLPCFLSDSITRQAQILNTTKFISLKEHPRSWASAICMECILTNEEREKVADVVLKYGYNILNQLCDMEKMYCGEN